MEYKPLDLARNEIRVLKIPRGSELDSSPDLELPPLFLENVSLDDFNEESKAYMESKAVTKFPSADYFDWFDSRQINASLPTIQDSLDGESLDQDSISRYSWAGGYSEITGRFRILGVTRQKSGKWLSMGHHSK